MRLFGRKLAGLVRVPEVSMEDGAERKAWLHILEQLATPVLSALADGRLRATMPVESHVASSDRARYTHLEAFARLLAGIAPWLELGADASAEGRTRAHYAQLARAALRAAVDPASPDYLNFADGMQPVVDIGFLAQAILRAPNELWLKLDTRTQEQLAAALLATRSRRPLFNNWLLFAGIVEAALHRMGRPYDSMRVDYAVRQHEQWYLGDGAYGDGPQWHWDYYNSFVIQPMLVDIAQALAQEAEWQPWQAPILQRARRYAAVSERLISPEGTFPPLGRSLAYRFGVLQALGQAALLDNLPDGLAPGGVRAAMTAVITRMASAPNTFDHNGWLTIGFCGAQPGIGEPYISTGSCYLCAVGLLPLGLPDGHPFWTAPAEPWTAQKLWGGTDLPPDKHI
jgi:hypothetical protein